ncbi:MAG: helix-turn-helix transcriptional regulator [Clostridiales bacterium]|nr:helix-turn-helix transcriptional regulator [Clostridiales bacterium]
MFGEMLKQLRKQCSYTQAEISKILGIDRSTYAYYESEKTQPNIETIIKIARVYNITTDSLLGVEKKDAKSFVVADGKNDSFPIENFSVPGYISELTKEERELILIYRAVDNKKRIKNFMEKEYKKQL